MIHPTEEDVENKRRVFYLPIRGPREYGTITGFDHYKVFVCYDGEDKSRATAGEDLFWER